MIAIVIISNALANVTCYQDHPRKLFFRNGIIPAATITDSPSSASFMPLSRILSKCAFIINLKVKFDYGEDKVCVAIPVKRHYLF